ncbi:MAG: type II toxin-antitoxin system VapC family toxin [Gammaproteobacteria bacterium]|nr:type II toxin-antitoxin system VapC family toxin [Gammaproteobacteria bacterium]MBU1654093.1 type II toxin-antitoxin system VapC family toxin [Gammaproteobacteria bacterium]MBU1961374.1 type II toxin-antitoxin system VapC family toxin [Gammaproteobacteria bacterium]
MSGFVWDASAILAFLRREPGVDRLEAVLDETPEHRLSAVNLAEVAGWFNDRGMPGDTLRALLDELDLEVIALDSDLARATGELRQATKALGLSLGDRACLALAKAHQAVALTADRAWVLADLGIRIECIRPNA